LFRCFLLPFSPLQQGAFQLDGSMLRGRTLVNLDTEDWGEVYIGCAGGGDSKITVSLAVEPIPGGTTTLELAVGGLMGGHSGLNIHEGRGNAVKMAADAAEAVLAAVPGSRLGWIRGGDKRNAIPRECTAAVVVPAGSEDTVNEVVARLAADLAQEYGNLEIGLRVEAVTSATAPTAVLAPADAQRLLGLLLTLPHGVLKMSDSVDGLVETSTNLASVRPVSLDADPEHQSYFVQCSTRSSLMPALERCRAAIKRLAHSAGADIEQDVAYPGWQPDAGTEVVRLAREAIEKVTGEVPPVKAIHAGLECGIIGEKLPG
jgi:dipeptidase D